MTVIIPAWNAAGTLPRVLASLFAQMVSGDAVVVIDDGSTDRTEDILAQARRMYGSRLETLQQSARGPAAARNTGLTQARGAVVLFLGADIVPAPSLLSRHRAVHAQYPEERVGCLGFVTWDPALPPNPLMTWLEHGGGQNAYGELAGSRWVDPRSYCYGANLSWKRTLLERVGGFDSERFSYGWEDIDLGHRLAAAGARLFYEPAARAYHVHRQTLTSWCARMRHMGSRLPSLVARHPHAVALPKSASGWRYGIRAMVYPSPLGLGVYALARLAQDRWILPSVFVRVEGWEFTKSVHEELALLSSRVDNPRSEAYQLHERLRGRFSLHKAKK